MPSRQAFPFLRRRILDRGSGKLSKGGAAPAWKIEQIINTFSGLDVHARQQEWRE